ncbi:Kelch repeat-containing protein [Colwelliaceae bacterium BS250]
MNIKFKLIFTFILGSVCTVSAQTLPNLPEPVTNNAVAQVQTKNGDYLLSFMGLGVNKSYQDVHNKVWALNVGEQQWRVKTPVPSTLALKGRLASVAVGVGEFAYIFGGYTVDKHHQEISTPDVYRYDVVNDEYLKLASMPVPVDDSVALVYQQRYIYLVSGWHNAGNVNLVQVYDIKMGTWAQASPFLGVPVFGHAAALSGNSILVCDGVSVVPQRLARRTYAEVAQCLLGLIDPNNILAIDWQKVDHPNVNNPNEGARYRMAAAEVAGDIVMLAGSTNPYNYNGMGYDGVPAPATAQAWVFDINTKQWRVVSLGVEPSMDHRGLLIYERSLITLGGMNGQQKVINNVITRSLIK